MPKHLFLAQRGALQGTAVGPWSGRACPPALADLRRDGADACRSSFPLWALGNEKYRVVYVSRMLRLRDVDPPATRPRPRLGCRVNRHPFAIC
eukprot:2154109-Prymnesium_polylepis.2